MADRTSRRRVTCAQAPNESRDSPEQLSGDNGFPSLRFQVVTLLLICFLYLFVLICPLFVGCKKATDDLFNERDRTPLTFKGNHCRYNRCKIASVTSLTFCLIVVSVYLYLPVLRGSLKGKVLVSYLIAEILMNVETLLQRFNVDLDSFIDNEVWQMRYERTIRFMSMTWLTLMCFDMWSKFCTSRRMSSNRPHLRRFFIYSLVGWGDPILLVAVSAYTGSGRCNSSTNIGTSETQSCEKDKDNIVCLVLCQSLKVAINLVMFVFTAVKGIHQCEALRRNPPASADTKWLKLVRLGLLMGFEWSVGLVQYAVSIVVQGVDHKSTALLMLILQQKGLLLFVFLVCNKNVCASLRERWRPAQEQTEDRSIELVGRSSISSRENTRY